MSTVLADATYLADLADRIAGVNEANGWYEEARTYGTDIALLHSEVAEMTEAYRAHGLEDATVGEPTRAEGGIIIALPKPEGVAAELADVIIRLLDTGHRTHTDWGRVAEKATQQPMTAFRDFGEAITMLHRAIDRLYPWNEPKGYSVLLGLATAQAGHWGIDLPAEIDRKITYNTSRGYRHGGKRI